MPIIEGPPARLDGPIGSARLKVSGVHATKLRRRYDRDWAVNVVRGCTKLRVVKHLLRQQTTNEYLKISIRF
jgi:hypothetical protein